jgi:SAM-dependent methyltransferase
VPSSDTDSPAGDDFAGLDALLALSAPLAAAAAERHCHYDPIMGQSCHWFHAAWQYLRMLDLVSTPHRHRSFFLEALGALARDGGHDRILISGAADYAMLELVLEAYEGSPSEPEIVVVDRCETPLTLNRWFAERRSIAVATETRDILDFESERPFDVICTHSFLVFIPPSRRADLVARWRRLLRPGGKVLTINRVRPDAPAQAAGFSAEQIETFRDKALQAAAGRSDLGEATPEVLASYAERYARHHRPYPVRSWERLRDLFEQGGFTVDSLRASEAGMYWPSGAASAAQTKDASTKYAHIICTRG